LSKAPRCDAQGFSRCCCVPPHWQVWDEVGCLRGQAGLWASRHDTQPFPRAAGMNRPLHSPSGPQRPASCFAREKSYGDRTLRASAGSASAAKWWGEERWAARAACGDVCPRLPARCPGVCPWESGWQELSDLVPVLAELFRSQSLSCLVFSHIAKWY